MDHGLVKSDINPTDRQNFSFCIKISSDDVLKILYDQNDTKGTYVYLLLINLTISAFIDTTTPIDERLYYAWVVVFTSRLWWALLQHATIQNDKDDNVNRTITKATYKKKLNKRHHFMTSAYLSIEINAHNLLYIILLVIEQHLPEHALDIFLFNSQSCENTFRTVRSLSSTFSIITNSTISDFIRCEQISILNDIKSEKNN
ncbi:unnamed protein product [Didymodactylos carnosus]|uniref:Uncharacterized protein n=1 Tax=Didymodactylos carnosus TaxID=1234261 RepID=A0A815U632_9BILA|nr:unnamed protein product [Didymodactylos carnosus]CAF1514316.1 unnamed protein product [Didymodactylos carnosus]CAF3766565.1 unnamed protein product [Didymodactylos carnosus]CAF4374491.1 unnamed protein product [Didymodactylos carnosus]